MRETVLYLVRHGETEYNRRRIMQGRRINSELNETGRAQAQALAARLADVPLDAIYSSTLRRAEETAAIVAERHEGVPVRQMAALEEMSWGIYEGEPFSSRIEAVFADLYERWAAGDFGHRVEEGESILDVQARALRALNEIVARHPGETVLVVSHGRLLRVLLSTVLEEYGLARMHDIHHANTAVNHLRHRAGSFTAELLNCTAHLQRVETILIE